MATEKSRIELDVARSEIAKWRDEVGRLQGEVDGLRDDLSILRRNSASCYDVFEALLFDQFSEESHRVEWRERYAWGGRR